MIIIDSKESLHSTLDELSAHDVSNQSCYIYISGDLLQFDPELINGYKGKSVYTHGIIPPESIYLTGEKYKLFWDQ